MRYTMECKPCGKEFEVGATVADMEKHLSGEKKIRCPKCKRRPLELQLSPIRFRIN